MGTFLQDFRYGLRQLRANPGFALTAIACLALGIAATTAILSVLNAFLFRPLPFPGADRLVQISLRQADGKAVGPFTYSEFEDYRRQVRLLSGVTARTFLPLALRSGDRLAMVQSEIVGDNYFSLLRVPPYRGRFFRPDEDRVPGGDPVVVLSHRLWRSWFGGSDSALGASVRLNGHGFTVIGVAPEDFQGATPVVAADLWIPLSMRVPLLSPVDDARARDARLFGVIGRLAGGVPLEKARSETVRIGGEEGSRDASRDAARTVTINRFTGVGIPESSRGSSVRWAAVLLSVAALTLLIACSNVANLLLVRASVREGEMGLRLAVGASRGRILRQLLTESVQLSLLGGLAGFFLASWATRLLYLYLPRTPGHISFTLDFTPDLRVFWASLLIAAATGVLFGLVPARRATRPGLLDAVRDGTATSSPGRRVRLRDGLVALQVGISALLLVVAGLELRSLQKSLASNPGFGPDHVLTAIFDLTTRDYGGNGGRSRLEELLARIRGLPGVRSASLADRLPLSGRRSRARFRVEGRPAPAEDRELPSAETLAVSPGHFASLKVPLLQGRDFQASDADPGRGAAIVNSSFARLYWPEGGALGRRLTLEGSGEKKSLEVIGVAADVSYTTLGEQDEPVLYLPFQPDASSQVSLLIRVDGRPETWIPAVRGIFRDVDPDLAIADLAPLQEQLTRAVLPYRSVGVLFGAMAAASLLLAAIGIYGVASYSVRQRTREIGIRLALGAAADDVLRLILRSGLGVVAVGLAGGLGAALVAGRVLASFLFGVNAADPVTLLGVPLVVLAVAFLAIAIPGRRATRVEPASVLRQG